MRERSKPYKSSLLQSVRPQIKRFANYCKQTKLCLIGGILLSLLMLLILLGCSPQLITRCSVDRASLKLIPVPVKPENPIDGDLATSHRKLSEEIILDNARKVRLDKQLLSCQ